MPNVECNAPTVTVSAIPERPDRLWLTETIARTKSESGEALEIQRTNNPFVWRLKGERNEATIHFEMFLKEALLHVLRENDYSEPAADEPGPAFASEMAKKETTSDHRIEVMSLGSGRAAVHTVLVHEEGKEPYRDIQNTGVGRYANRAEAVTEARMWSQSDEIELHESVMGAG